MYMSYQQVMQYHKTERCGRTSLWYHVGWDCDNPAQLGSFSEQEAVAHPRKEMRETVMASSNALGDVSASTGEGQRVDAVMT
jgi:hypothetical protein